MQPDPSTHRPRSPWPPSLAATVVIGLTGAGLLGVLAWAVSGLPLVVYLVVMASAAVLVVLGMYWISGVFAKRLTRRGGDDVP